MKKIIGLIIFNLILVLFVFYKINISSNDVKVSYLKNVNNLNIDDGMEKLQNFEISVLYIDSELTKDTILYTEPKANSLVYDNQMITLFVSKGYSTVKFKNLENQVYDNCIEYIENIKKAYNLNVVITYKENKYLLDGLIHSQIITDEYIDQNDTLELVVISNKKVITLPDFIGWHYKDVILYANEKDLRIEFEYVEIFYASDYVVGQSVNSGTKVLKNSNSIKIYLAK